MPDDAAELNMDFFTGKTGRGFIVTHYFMPEVASQKSSKMEDKRSNRQKALGPAAEFAIFDGKLRLLKVRIS